MWTDERVFVVEGEKRTVELLMTVSVERVVQVWSVLEKRESLLNMYSQNQTQEERQL